MLRRFRTQKVANARDKVFRTLPNLNVDASETIPNYPEALERKARNAE